LLEKYVEKGFLIKEKSIVRGKRERPRKYWKKDEIKGKENKIVKESQRERHQSKELIIIQIFIKKEILTI